MAWQAADAGARFAVTFQGDMQSLVTLNAQGRLQQVSTHVLHVRGLFGYPGLLFVELRQCLAGTATFQLSNH